jgi:hypothetical protein
LVKRRRVIDRRADWADIQNVAVGIDVATNDPCYRGVYMVRAFLSKAQPSVFRDLCYGIGGDLLATRVLESRLDNPIAWYGLVGPAQHVIVAQDKVDAFLIYNQRAERAATALDQFADPDPRSDVSTRNAHLNRTSQPLTANREREGGGVDDSDGNCERDKNRNNPYQLRHAE